MIEDGAGEDVENVVFGLCSLAGRQLPRCLSEVGEEDLGWNSPILI